MDGRSWSPVSPLAIFVTGVFQVLPVMALAQDAASLDAYLEILRETVDVAGIETYDISSNGIDEALVRTNDCEGDLCAWSLVAFADGGWRVVGSSWAGESRFEPSASGGGVVWSDGVTWAWSGGWIYPFDDVVSRSREMMASKEDVAFVVGNTRWDDASLMDLTVYRLDLLGTGWNQNLFVVGGLAYLAGPSGYPYVISDRNGAILDEGYSVDPPAIYRTPDGAGATVLRRSPSGFEMIEIRVPEPVGDVAPPAEPLAGGSALDLADGVMMQ